MSKKIFEGIDWTELSERFGIDINQEDEVIAEQTKSYLLANSISDKKKETAKTIRQYLKPFIKGLKVCGYDAPLYEGMLKIKHDETLIKYATHLLECMWY